MIKNIYQQLKKHSPQTNWWPASRNFKPKEFEVCVGAVLTQNTNWNNVEKALDNLKKENLVSAKQISELKPSALQKIIKPAGFYNQKSVYLKNLADFITSFNSFTDFSEKVSRKHLLSVKGIGKETADSILLYACNRPYFVIDAFTKRIFSRLGLVSENAKYEDIKKIFESGLPKNAELYKEFHALIVEHAKKYCRKKPLCEKCFLKHICKCTILR